MILDHLIGVSSHVQRCWMIILFTSSLFVLASCSGAEGSARNEHGAKNDPSLSNQAASPPEKFTTCRELLTWREKNESEFHVTKATGDWRMDVEYRSPYCIACAEQPDAALTDDDIVQRLGELDSTYQLVLRAMTAIDSNYFDAEVLRTACSIRTLQDTIPCVFAHREMVPTMVPYRTYLLGFEGPKWSDDVVILSVEPGPTRNPWTFTFSSMLSEYLSTSAASVALDPSW